MRHQLTDIATDEWRQVRLQPAHDLLAVVEREGGDELGTDGRAASWSAVRFSLIWSG